MSHSDAHVTRGLATSFSGCEARDCGRLCRSRSFAGWHQFSSVQPNAAHDALARLQRGNWAAGGFITQNVDRLHQKAGARDVLEIHGTTHECAQALGSLKRARQGCFITAPAGRGCGEWAACSKKRMSPWGQYMSAQRSMRRGSDAARHAGRVICMRCGEVTPREPFQARLAELNPKAAAAVARALVSSDAAGRLVDPGEDGGLQVHSTALATRGRRRVSQS